CLSALKHHDRAVAAFVMALRLKPDYADAHYSLGIALLRLGRNDDAVKAFARAVAMEPGFAEAHNNLGLALTALGRYREAVGAFEASLALQTSARTFANLGAALHRLGREEESIAAFERALALDPDLADTRAQKLYQERLICLWTAGFGPASLADLGVKGEAVRPFVMLPLDDAPARQRARAERFSKGKFIQAEIAPFVRPATPPGRLRIGYFSANFHDHAVMQMLARLLELHDRARFEIHAYSYGPDSDDAMRRRVKGAVEAFHDARPLDDRATAQLARDHGIHIAVDLMGHTENARTEIFAYRAAPVQIAYLGYPGTMGAAFMDYLIADPVVIPESAAGHYSENIVFLPGSYMPGDDRREISPTAPTRADMGLPERGFVFCCFNNSYKLSPTEFTIWMRLLREVKASALWLNKPNSWALRNLRNEALNHGVEPGRLVFAERVGMAEHLARHRLADLFLDTFGYNAHSTASDALWAGLPLITKPGRSFAARVAASLLEALGLPEMIADSEPAYERLALMLARDPEKLTAVRAKLWQLRQSSPLFDSARVARHLESAYALAYGRYLRGEPAADMHIT
ncbi:MAG: tetratricopeptide repeat protein, partial [Rhizomicrobium sp.]